MVPRNMDRQDSESSPSFEFSHFDNRHRHAHHEVSTTFLAGQSPVRGSKSPSPSSEYGSRARRSPRSPSSPLNSSMLLYQYTSSSSSSDLSLEAWIRREVDIPSHLPVSLNSLPDPAPDERPAMSLKWIMALAIYGSARRKLTLSCIYGAVEEKYPYYRNIPDKKWQVSSSSFFWILKKELVLIKLDV